MALSHPRRRPSGRDVAKHRARWAPAQIYVWQRDCTTLPRRLDEHALIPTLVDCRITDKVDQAADELRKVPAFTKLLGNDNAFIPLNADEIAFIDSFTTKDHRVVEMSEGVIEGDEISITKGPLVHHTALVKKIDRHKRLAYVETTMFGRTLNLKVGLEIVRKHNNKPV